MFKQIIGAAVGSKLAKQTPVIGGAAGAAIGTAVPFIISRMSLPAMVVMGAGGYFAKRFFDKKKAEQEVQQLTGSKSAKIGVTPKSKTGTVINPPTSNAASANGSTEAVPPPV